MNDTTTPLWLQVPEPSELVRRFGSAVGIPAFGGRGEGWTCELPLSIPKAGIVQVLEFRIEDAY